jgi:hypothetical protein
MAARERIETEKINIHGVQKEGLLEARWVSLYRELTGLAYELIFMTISTNLVSPLQNGTIEQRQTHGR